MGGEGETKISLDFRVPSIHSVTLEVQLYSVTSRWCGALPIHCVTRKPLLLLDRLGIQYMERSARARMYTYTDELTRMSSYTSVTSMYTHAGDRYECMCPNTQTHLKTQNVTAYTWISSYAHLLAGMHTQVCSTRADNYRARTRHTYTHTQMCMHRCGPTRMLWSTVTPALPWVEVSFSR